MFALKVLLLLATLRVRYNVSEPKK